MKRACGTGAFERTQTRAAQHRPVSRQGQANYQVGSYVLRISSLRRVNQDESGVRRGPPPYGMIGGILETLASFEARYAPLSCPTAGAVSNDRRYRDTWW
jgi:hypothetical protein